MVQRLDRKLYAAYNQWEQFFVSHGALRRDNDDRIKVVTIFKRFMLLASQQGSQLQAPHKQLEGVTGS